MTRIVVFLIKCPNCTRVEYVCKARAHTTRPGVFHKLEQMRAKALTASPPPLNSLCFTSCFSLSLSSLLQTPYKFPDKDGMSDVTARTVVVREREIERRHRPERNANRRCCLSIYRFRFSVCLQNTRWMDGRIFVSTIHRPPPSVGETENRTNEGRFRRRAPRRCLRDMIVFC